MNPTTPTTKVAAANVGDYAKGYRDGWADHIAQQKEATTTLFKTPDVTPVQFVGLVGAIVSTALAFGVDLTSMQQHVLIADAGVIGALLFGDAAIRHGRATGNAKKDV